jgi:predicted aconitase
VYEGEPLKNDIDYELFGWVAGEALGNDVPAFVNIGRPTVSQLVKMNSALNTGGQVRMYHIPGMTPEASSVEEAFRHKKPEKEIVIRRSDLRDAYEMINAATNRDVDYVYLGCPFYNIVEVQKAANLLHGRKCKANLWVVTSPGVYRLAERMGLKEAIERSGARFLSGVCACEMRGELLPFEVMATDAMKQNYYITGHLHPRKPHVWYGAAEECIDAAVTGIWRGEWR